MNGSQFAFRPRRKNPAFAATAVFALAFAVVAVVPCLVAQDWPQWRGPTRDGVVTAANAPSAWPDAFRATWRLEVGEGHSSPVVSGGRVFVHSRRDPNEVIVAIALADGKVLWERVYPAPFEKNAYARRVAKGPHATPLVAGDRLFTLGATAVLKAWDTATGRELWGRDFSKSIDTSKMFCGTAASPLLVDGRVVVQVGSDIHGGQVVALEATDGAEKWKWTGPGPGYASPMLIEVGGYRQIPTLTERSLVGLDARSGQQLWSVAFPDEWHENIVTPLWTGSHLIVSGIRQGTRAYTLEQTDGQWHAAPAWENAEVAMYMSSPVSGDGVIYAHSAKKRGQFVALDTETGAIRWASEGRDGDQASVLLTPDHVLYLTNAGELVVVWRKSKAFEVEHRYKLGDHETWAMPLLLDNGMLLRDSASVTRLAPE